MFSRSSSKSKNKKAGLKIISSRFLICPQQLIKRQKRHFHDKKINSFLGIPYIKTDRVFFVADYIFKQFPNEQILFSPEGRKQSGNFFPKAITNLIKKL